MNWFLVSFFGITVSSYILFSLHVIIKYSITLKFCFVFSNLLSGSPFKSTHESFWKAPLVLSNYLFYGIFNFSQNR